MKAVVIAAALALLACLPDGKESVELPPVTSTLEARLVGALDSDGARDVRTVRTSGDRLLVTDETGLYIYDISTPSTPTLAGTIADGRVDHVAFLGDAVYLIEVSGDRLREWDVSDPAAPVMLADERSITRTFGGIDARDDLVWHAVGSSPPSRLFYRARPISLESSCLADDQERGIMDVWLYPGLVILSVHFDDFAGDGLDGNGGFGFAIFELDTSGEGCPRTRLGDTFLARSHGLNRSTFEESTNSDLQAAFDEADRTLYLTGEQRIRRLNVSRETRLTEVAALAVPEVLDVELDASRTDGPVLGLANGDFVLVDARATGALDLAAVVATPGIARSVAAASDGATFYVADGTSGVAIIEYEEPIQ